MKLKRTLSLALALLCAAVPAAAAPTTGAMDDKAPSASHIAGAPRRAAPKDAPALSEARFTAYAYCPCARCCGKWAGGPTASGTTPAEGRTIAVDPSVIPLGTRVLVDGREYVAEDTGSGVGGRTIDLFFESHREALAWGRRTVTVQWPRAAAQG